jgi:hypothetical protein
MKPSLRPRRSWRHFWFLPKWDSASSRRMRSGEASLISDEGSHGFWLRAVPQITACDPRHTLVSSGRSRVQHRPYLLADAESWVPICRRATTQIAGLPSGPIVGPIVTCCTAPLFQRTRTS